MKQRNYFYGVLFVLAGGVCLSLAGILLRHVQFADGWQILFYRAIAFCVTLFIIIFFRYRSKTFQAFKAVGGRGLLAAGVLGLGSVCYVFAILTTTVANAVFIIGASPMVTALIGWLFLRERISLLGSATMLVAFLGIGLMFMDGIANGRWFGNVMAILVVASFAIFLVLLRSCRNIDMLPATCMGGVVTALIAGFMANDLTITNHDLVIALILGSVQFGGGFWFITIGTRYIPASEVALFSLSEAILAPLWVWIGVNETPSMLTISGCFIVLIAVSTHCLIGIRQERVVNGR